MINFVFDFDSTLVKSESLNEAISLSINKDLQKQLELENITKMGMEGKIGFKESLEKRICLASINKSIINNITNEVKENITAGMEKFVEELLEQNGTNIFIVSGGFTEMIVPVAKILNIPEKNIFANTFVYNKNDEVVGVEDCLLLQEAGKAKIIEKLKKDNIIRGKTIMIGDGYTDLETYLNSVVDNFICFCGVVDREVVRKQSPLFAHNVDELRKVCFSEIKNIG